MDRLDALRIFLAVADLGSFAGAARRLRLSSAAATRAVQALEADLGTSLLHRTTRSVRLTDTGAAYAERCRRLLAEFDDARRVLELNEPNHPYLTGDWPDYPWTVRKLNPFASEKSAIQ